MLYRICICCMFLLTGWSCKSGYQFENQQDQWYNIAVVDGVEIFIDSTSIKHDGSTAYAREMRVYTNPESKNKYIDKIREAYRKLGKEKEADKWSDFNFCVYNCIYECINKRFRIISIEDYDSTGKRIAKTNPSKNKITWLNIEPETVGDYTFFYVCDFGN